jgi:hypothetical protein
MAQAPSAFPMPTIPIDNPLSRISCGYDEPKMCFVVFGLKRDSTAPVECDAQNSFGESDDVHFESCRRHDSEKFSSVGVHTYNQHPVSAPQAVRQGETNERPDASKMPPHPGKPGTESLIALSRRLIGQ